MSERGGAFLTIAKQRERSRSTASVATFDPGEAGGGTPISAHPVPCVFWRDSLKHCGVSKHETRRVHRTGPEALNLGWATRPRKGQRRYSSRSRDRYQPGLWTAPRLAGVERKRASRVFAVPSYFREVAETCAARYCLARAVSPNAPDRVRDRTLAQNAPLRFRAKPITCVSRSDFFRRSPCRSPC